MSEVVRYELKESIGVISVDNPPVNALAQVVREGILKALEQAQSDDSKAIVLRCEGRTFIAGADITEFGKPPIPAAPAGLEYSFPSLCRRVRKSRIAGGKTGLVARCRRYPAGAAGSGRQGRPGHDQFR